MESITESQDLFSNHSELYSQGRPKHPPELFAYLKELVPSLDLAWDVACGSGQATLELSKLFKRVVATDLSSLQIECATKVPNIEYHVEPAEEPNSMIFQPQSVDLITAAAGVHWFPLENFYMRVKKVLKPDGILACWSYSYPIVNKKVDAVMLEFEDKYLNPFKPKEMKYSFEKYRSLPWPFRLPKENHCDSNGVDHRFIMKKKANLDQYCSYLRSRSPAQLYKKANNKDPVDLLYPSFLEAWDNDPETVRDVSWPVFLRLGQT